MKSLVIYFQERFPLLQVGIFAGGYGLLVVGVLDRVNALKFGLVAAFFISFLLRQRITDEFKDARHDNEKYPDRPLPRGLVTRSQLLVVGAFALGAEVLSAWLLGGARAFPCYLLMVLYSVLMAREFFASDWLEAHFTTYYLSHEVIFGFFAAFFVVALAPERSLDLAFVLPAGLVLVAAPAGVEVIRKFKLRRDPQGKIVRDTYPAVWGRRNSLLVLCAASVLVGIGLFLLSHNPLPVVVALAISGAWQVLGRSSDKIVFLIGVVNFLGMGALSLYL